MSAPLPPDARRAPRLPAALFATCLLLLSCGGPAQPAAPPRPLGESTLGAPSAEVAGALAPPNTAFVAFTYDQTLAPVGAQLIVSTYKSSNRVLVRLEAIGLLPNRGYAAHVHQLPCGTTGAAAGPHHQHELDPAATPDKPSTDPAFANPRNEIWLDLRTDARGNGEGNAWMTFVVDDRPPASVILHEAESTATEPGKAGTAGARVACLNVPFASALME